MQQSHTSRDNNSCTLKNFLNVIVSASAVKEAIMELHRQNMTSGRGSTILEQLNRNNNNHNPVSTEFIRRHRQRSGGFVDTQFIFDLLHREAEQPQENNNNIMVSEEAAPVHGRPRTYRTIEIPVIGNNLRSLRREPLTEQRKIQLVDRVNLSTHVNQNMQVAEHLNALSYGVDRSTQIRPEMRDRGTMASTSPTRFTRFCAEPLPVAVQTNVKTIFKDTMMKMLYYMTRIVINIVSNRDLFPGTAL